MSASFPVKSHPLTLNTPKIVLNIIICVNSYSTKYFLKGVKYFGGWGRD
jgi:hypothetical protein